MNQVVPRKQLWQSQLAPFAGLLLLLLLLTGCFGGGDEAAPEAVAPEAATQQTGTLTCSQTCLNQGQCGVAADGRTVILASSNQPTFRDHNAILENESAIIIAGQQTLNISNFNGTPGTLNFFAVQPTGGGPTNWVAGSCVNLNQ
ncbi:hypothetical protein [Candidatus Leptofilum sp.]|uniref:hypothetical protein n=1 Tax=Candidatus Leptofilum sp. TaxID=3241576 RepID=UPI003B5A8735